MSVADPLRFGLGLLLLPVGAALLWHAKGSRGFNQKKQAGVLSFIVAAIFLALGLGLVET